MRVFVDGIPRTLPEDCTVRSTVAALSPFGEEPVTVVVNGVRMDMDADAVLSEGDDLRIFPLLIGG